MHPMCLHKERLRKIRLLILDVDGVLTSGQIIYDGLGNELKIFDVQDGLGLVLLKHIRVSVMWISGRSHPGTEKRGIELGVERVYQGVRDKRSLIVNLVSELNIDLQDVAYMGDDWNDLAAFEIVGLRCAVANAATEVRKSADIVTEARGGQGAVRELCTMLLESHEMLDRIVQDYLFSLTVTPIESESVN